MIKLLYHPYTNKNGKNVSGNAALLHYIKKVGGIQAYHDEIGIEYITNFVKKHSDAINWDYIAKSRRDKFKVV